MTADIRATYRVQLRPDFGFDAAAEIADYLSDLGISHVYTSPVLQAVPGSAHGYDVVDPRRLSEDLGGAAAHGRLLERLGAQKLGWVLDIVPNHMAIAGRENPWWWDVLESGPSSPYAAYFDVDWDPPEARLRNTVLLPVLADHYGRVLEAGGFGLVRDGAAFTIRYDRHAFPVAPRSLSAVLAQAAARCGAVPDAKMLGFLANGLRDLPLPTSTDEVSVGRRQDDKAVLHDLLAKLLAEAPGVSTAVDATVAEINRHPDALHALLEEQNYRLAFWRAAERDLGYRRFFDVTTLAGLRVEDPRVFADTHTLVLRWLTDGVVDGLRIDHPDGLRDPEAYVRRLATPRPDAWLLVEKILAPDERLPETWPVAGTTGYDFLNQVGGLFVDPAGEGPLTSLYDEFTGEPTDFAVVARAKKHLIMRDTLGSDVNRLTALFLDVCERHPRHRDYTRHELHEALRETIADLGVYRTYVRAGSGPAGAEDSRRILTAVAAAKSHRADLDATLFDFLGELLTLQFRGDRETELAMRVQQLSGAVMAKGVEDTAFYCFTRLLSLNEVGGDPGRFGVEPEAFHRWCLETQARWPGTMLTTSTHDTKRSEDVRARLHVLSELPDRWADTVRRWARQNQRHWPDGPPDRNMEYLLYQTLVGAWPLEIERLAAYVEKAAREAKAHTSWTAPNTVYEAALRRFVEAVLADAPFRADLESFVALVERPGRVNALSQTLIKLTAPGVPDLYQGTELWDLSLVDPDNRRPVDYGLRRCLLAELDGRTPEEIWDRADTGLPKLWVVRQALALRRRRPEWFGPSAAYRPLPVSGRRREHVVAFARADSVATVAPRLVARLDGDWGETAVSLPVGRWKNELTGETQEGSPVRAAELLGRFPVALLSRSEGP